MTFLPVSFPKKNSPCFLYDPLSHGHCSHNNNNNNKLGLYYLLSAAKVYISNNAEWLALLVVSPPPVSATCLLSLILLKCSYQHSIAQCQKWFIRYYNVRIFRTGTALSFPTFIKECPKTFTFPNTYQSTTIKTPTLYSAVVLSSHKTAGNSLKYHDGMTSNVFSFITNCVLIGVMTVIESRDGQVDLHKALNYFGTITNDIKTRKWLW
jgi:hypothetical protein